MNASATLGAVRQSGITDDGNPVVLVNGVPDHRLSVVSLSVTGPLDRRSALLVVDTSQGVPGVYAHQLCAEAVVALPMRLSDDSLRWRVLSRGVLKDVTDEEAAGRAGRYLRVVDAWDDTLSRPSGEIWWQNPGGVAVKQIEGKLLIGENTNRSSDTHTVNGQTIYVLERDSGLRWSVGEALASISAFSSLSLNLAGVPREVMDAELIRPVDLTGPVNKALEDILDDYHLTLRRDMVCEDGLVVERRHVRPTWTGRPIDLGWSDNNRAIGEVLKVGIDRPAQGMRRWVARADGWRVESTFELVGGWDPAQEGQADDEYDKQASSDFKVYENAYRRWVLNEDGFFTAAPYSRGPAYDLTALFGMGGVEPQPLEFESNLTLRDDGSPYKPIVEMSTNSGTDWSLFPAATDILDDRAGVYLDPTTLPAPFLTAAKAGTARVRVTASLSSPLPLDIERWHGNAITGTLPPLVLDVSDVFMFKRVDESSIHYPDVASGTLIAEESDDTIPMHRWLVDRMTRHQMTAPADGLATLELTGTWAMLRPGDRLMNVRGPGVTADGWPQAMTSRGAIVRSIENRFVSDGDRGRTTTVKLAF